MSGVIVVNYLITGSIHAFFFSHYEASGEIQILANFSSGRFIKYISLRRFKKIKTCDIVFVLFL